MAQIDFGDFLGEVKEELVGGTWSPAAGDAVSARHFLEVTVSRNAAVCSSSRAGALSLGQATVEARALLDRGRHKAISLQQSFSYCWRSALVRSALPAAAQREPEQQAAAEGSGALRVDGERRQLSLSVPLPFGCCTPRLADVLSAWATVAMRSLAGAAAEGPPLPTLASLVALPALAPLAQSVLAAVQSAGPAVAGAATAGLELPLKVCGLDGLRVSEGALGPMHLGQGLATHVGLFSLTSATMFIFSIKGLGEHSTAREGVWFGVLATALGMLSVLVSPGFGSAHMRFFTTFLLAGGLGLGVANSVSMEEMPQLVAGFHSFVGLAAVFAGFASYLHPEPFHLMKALETVVGTAVGMLTFTGSVVAAGKLHGTIPGRPIVLERRWFLNFLGLCSSLGLSALFCSPSIHYSSFGLFCLAANTAIWGGLGANMVLPIGGADMPVVVSLLNAFSGLATSSAGFMLSNNLLTITGALVASSGTLLSDIMCRGINRSMGNVLLGGFGTDGSASASVVATGTAADVKEVSPMGFVDMLLGAKRVVIVPGYGLAVARCQSRLADVVALLRSHGVVVHFAIHPVAGRLPGHMNVLLAEADVPYDIVREMEDINPDMRRYDVAIVVGANDIVNPATQDDTSSPIYGMPAITVWEAKACVVLKRSMGTGYSGVDNPLFCKDNVHMLFGDAKHSLDTLFHLLEESQDRIAGQGPASEQGSPSKGSRAQREAEASYPVALKAVGVIRERRQEENRVSITPSMVPALRRMGFSVLLEAGAGWRAGFSDEDYLKAGGVQVAESASEVLQQADVILKVNEPLLEEVQVLQSTQTMAAFWNMYDTPELTEALKKSAASYVNLALVPRISRAQKLDALTSMANIAGYRAALDAFNSLPRFSRSSVTACGAVPPARVFVIGAGVAGLSAIATAHSLGAKVYANDVRAAVRDQVESLGAEFVPIEAEGIAGEGVGGYAQEMGEAFQRAQLATYARIIPDMDIVISTAMIPNRAAPMLIPEEVVDSMRRGSVVVDLAASAGGNCALSEADKTVTTAKGVTIIGETNYPSQMAPQASELFASNFVALLDTLGGASSFGGEHWEDAVIKPATIVHQGQMLWPPPRPAAPPPAAEGATPSSSSAPPAPLAPPAGQPPEEVSALIKWLQDHRHELALGLGAATVLGLGFGAEIPDAELTHIGYFVLSLLIGHFTVSGVTPALHTPLISVTNAISGIIVVGGMLQLSGPLLSGRVACALAAVFLSSINIVGGFAVTERMLQMFREDRSRSRALPL